MKRVEKEYKVKLFRPKSHDTYLIDNKVSKEFSTAVNLAQRVSSSIMEYNDDLVLLNKYVKSQDFDKWENDSIEVINSIPQQFTSLFSKLVSKMEEATSKIKTAEKETSETVSNVQSDESQISSGLSGVSAGAAVTAGVVESSDVVSSDSATNQNLAKQEQMDAQIKQAENEANQTVSSTNADMYKINAELESSASTTKDDKDIVNDTVESNSEQVDQGVSATLSKNNAVEIPSSLKQGGYTVTTYDTINWNNSSLQGEVNNIWKNQGSNYKDGIATVKVNGEDRYLVATSTKFGMSGDCIDIKLENGQTIPAIIADSKNSGDSNAAAYGHTLGDGSVNVLEWEVSSKKYKESGNPTTESYGLEWDSNSNVSSIVNQGSILN